MRWVTERGLCSDNLLSLEGIVQTKKELRAWGMGADGPIEYLPYIMWGLTYVLSDLKFPLCSSVLLGSIVFKAMLCSRNVLSTAVDWFVYRRLLSLDISFLICLMSVRHFFPFFCFAPKVFSSLSVLRQSPKQLIFTPDIPTVKAKMYN